MRMLTALTVALFLAMHNANTCHGQVVLQGLGTVVLGVEVAAIPDVEDAFKSAGIKLPVKIGLVLLHVEAHGPAANAKLQKYDVITNVNGKTVRTVEEFRTEVESLTVGKQYKVIGYHGVNVRGKTAWKKGTVNVTPVTRKDLFVNAMASKDDEVNDTTRFKHKDSAEFVNTESEFYCYFVSSAGLTPSLRIRIQYVSDDWLFIRRFTIKADDATFEIDVSGLGNVDRDFEGGKIWEWHDRPADENNLKMLDEILRSKRVILRCEGDKYIKDRDLTESEIDRIRSVLMAYQIMGGQGINANMARAGQLIQKAPQDEPNADAKGESKEGDSGRTNWANETYDCTFRWVKGKMWEEVDNKTGQVNFTYQETSRSKESIEIFCPKRKYQIRLLSKTLELKKDDKWTWVANGKWEAVNSSPKSNETPMSPVSPPGSLVTSLIGTKPGDFREITLPAGEKLTLIWCPPGTFTMGSPASEQGRNEDEDDTENAGGKPVDVALEKGFWLAQTETTQGQYAAVMGTSPWTEHGNPNDYKAGVSFPAVYINQTDAKAYCEKLTEVERQAGRLPTDWEYSLPSEAQWEYASRAGTKTMFSFGDDETLLNEYAWFAKNTGNLGKNFAHPVATKKANPWGFFDMHGNTWEWSRDGYETKLRGASSPIDATSATADGVLRGGSWYDSPVYCRSAYRLQRMPATRNYNLGFRIAAVGVGQAVNDRSSP